VVTTSEIYQDDSQASFSTSTIMSYSFLYLLKETSKMISNSPPISA